MELSIGYLNETSNTNTIVFLVDRYPATWQVWVALLIAEFFKEHPEYAKYLMNSKAREHVDTD